MAESGDYRNLYARGLGLLTDLYQITMAQAAWRQKRHDLRAVFCLTLRRSPFGGDFAIAAGIEPALDYVQDLRFLTDDIDYLASLRSRSGKPLFDQDFLCFLAEFSPQCKVFSVAEGETLLAGSPMVRVEGGLLEAQLLETPLLNLIGVQTMVATRAARICHWAARGLNGRAAQSVLEFRVAPCPRSGWCRQRQSGRLFGWLLSDLEPLGGTSVRYSCQRNPRP